MVPILGGAFTALCGLCNPEGGGVLGLCPPSPTYTKVCTPPKTYVGAWSFDLFALLGAERSRLYICVRYIHICILYIYIYIYIYIDMHIP